MRVAFLALLLACAAAVTSPAQNRVVRIQVVDSGSGIPVPRARVVAASATPLPPSSADDHGLVVVDVPPSGRRIRVSKSGYVPAIVPLRGASPDIVVTLVPGGTIEGRIVDTGGMPIVGRAVIASASAPGAVPRTAQTDDRGAYHIGSLPAGTYRVSVGAGGTGAAVAARVQRASDVLPQVVVLRAGDEARGIDFVAPARTTCRAPAVEVRPGLGVGGGSIRGRVTTSEGQPLGCVEVVAFRGSARAASTVTDENGRYVLSRLRAGAYPVEFRKAAHVSRQWGQERAESPGRPVTVRDDEQVSGIDVILSRGGAISGIVVDEYGEAVDNVSVRALQLRGEDERSMAVAAGAAVTDERGHYRVFGLAPGRYLVGTTASTEPPDPRTGRGYAPVYFPGSVEIAQASSIDIAEAGERDGVNFPRTATRVMTVTGTAVNSSGLPITDRVILVASQRSGAVIAETQSAGVTGADGAFAIRNVPPGDYAVQATSKRDEDAPPEFGMEYVTVGEAPPLPLRIRTRPGADLEGRLVEDGTPLVDPQAFSILAVPTDWDQTFVLAGVQTLAAAADGRLSLAGVTGSRRFVLTSAPAGWYLHSIRMRGVDVTDSLAGFPVFGSFRDLEVVVSNRGAVLEGEAIDGNVPAADCSVLLFSSNPDHWFRHSRFVKATRANRTGRFRIDAIPDGDYFVVAIDPLDGVAGLAWQDRGFLQSLTVAARRVRLRPGEGRSMTLTVSHR